MDHADWGARGAAGALATVVGFLLNLYRRKVDRLESKVARQDVLAVQLKLLNDQLTLMRAERERTHTEHSTIMSEIRASIVKTNERIDQVLGGFVAR